MLPRLRVFLLVTVGLLGMVWIAGCGSLPGDAAAKVNGNIITKDDVARRIETLRKMYSSMVPEESDEEKMSNYRREVTDQLVKEELEREETEKRGITVSEEEIDARLQELADDQFLGEVSKVFEEFDAKGVSREDIRDDVRRTILHEKLQTEIGKDIQVTDADALEFFERNKASYVQPERRQVRQLVAGDEAVARTAVTRVQAGEDFINLVTELSIHPDGAADKKKGALGLVSPGQLAPELEKAVYSTPNGGISEPVSLGEQWYVFKIENVVNPIDTNFEDVKNDIIALYGNQQFSARWREFVDQVTSDAEIEYADDYDPAEITDTDSTS